MKRREETSSLSRDGALEAKCALVVASKPLNELLNLNRRSLSQSGNVPADSAGTFSLSQRRPFLFIINFGVNNSAINISLSDVGT